LSYKVLQLSPHASTAIQVPWCDSETSSPQFGLLPSWMEEENVADLAEGGGRNRAILGLALSIAFSASFWAGVTLIVTRVWR
jgi:hypothetical protein